MVLYPKTISLTENVEKRAKYKWLMTYGLIFWWLLQVMTGFVGANGPSKTLFVKNLSYDTTEEDLKDALDGATAARIIMDRDTGKSKGQVI